LFVPITPHPLSALILECPDSRQSVARIGISTSVSLQLEEPCDDSLVGRFSRPWSQSLVGTSLISFVCNNAYYLEEVLDEVEMKQGLLKICIVRKGERTELGPGGCGYGSMLTRKTRMRVYTAPSVGNLGPWG